ncbi:LTA synthase family protein [Soehngenia saccharolytica]|nr:LTA synthase family protein [Soehngenia saccharolytica]
MLEIFVFLKTILFMNLIKVENNRLFVVLLTSLITLGIIYIILSLNTNKKYSILFLFYFVFSVFLFANAMYFGYFNKLISIDAFTQAGQVGDVLDSIKELLNFKRLALLLDLPLLAAYLTAIVKNKTISKLNISEKKSKRLLLTSTVTVIILFIYITTIGQIKAVASDEIYSFYTSNLINYFKKDNEVENFLTEEDKLEELIHRETQTNEFTAIGENRNLIVIQVEALQNFVLFREINGFEITPNLNKLVKDSATIYYDNYFHLVGKGNTSDAEVATLNSLYPSLEEPTNTLYYDNSYYGLPWILRDNGYTTWAFHGYKRDFWNRDKAYASEGFQKFIAQDDFVFDNYIGFGIPDREFFKQSLEYIKELDQIDENPFFAFLITLTSHTPFKMPPNEKYTDLGELEGTLTGNYIHAIHYADMEVGRFIENLKSEGLYENSIISIYGDHFGIAAYDETESENAGKITNERYDYDTMMNIPLLIHVPGENINKTVSTVGSQLDFLPTILNIMGIKNEKGIMFGKDLNGEFTDNYVFPMGYIKEGSVISEEEMFVRDKALFENSRAFNRITREEIDIEKFRDLSERALEEINLSNYVLKSNYIDRLLNE